MRELVWRKRILLRFITEKISGRRPGRTGAGGARDWRSPGPGFVPHPALYVSDAGLTLDVLLFLDSGAVRTFCKKYAGVDGERLTPLEERMLEGERPSRRLPFPRA